jgi:hypothetical protein
LLFLALRVQARNYVIDARRVWKRVDRREQARRLRGLEREALAASVRAFNGAG